MYYLLKLKIKIWWYELTDHRYKTPLIWPVGGIVVIALVVGAGQRILFAIFSTAAVVAFFWLGCCIVGQVQFDRQVKKKQGSETIHDLQ